MSATTCTTIRGDEVFIMPNSDKQHKLEEIIRKVQTLRTLTKTTGFFTTRSIGALLANLSPDELVEVAEALELTPREMPRTR
jgi:hypothetical protein